MENIELSEEAYIAIPKEEYKRLVNTNKITLDAKGNVILVCGNKSFDNPLEPMEAEGIFNNYVCDHKTALKLYLNNKGLMLLDADNSTSPSFNGLSLYAEKDIMSKYEEEIKKLKSKIESYEKKRFFRFFFKE